jgi:hypothetical protein
VKKTDHSGLHLMCPGTKQHHLLLTKVSAEVDVTPNTIRSDAAMHSMHSRNAAEAETKKTAELLPEAQRPVALSVKDLSVLSSAV